MIQFLILTFLFSFFTLFHPADVLAAGAELDVTGPACSILYVPNTSPQVLGTVVNITVAADDSQTGDHGISVINLYQPSATLISTTASSSLSYPWNSTVGSYNFSATAKDTIGNPSSCINPIDTFVITATPSHPAWLQTIGGDVHSNTNINLPPGP